MTQYIDIQTASTQFQLCAQTVRKVFDEIDELTGKGKRYGSYTFRGEGKTRQVRYAVMDDYMRWRSWLNDLDARKHVPEFDVHSSEIELGVSNSTICVVDADRVAEKVLKALIGRIANGN